METVAIALVVGLFGGVAGAALGPFLGHIFNGWARKDVRRERRQEHLRSMIESRISTWRRYDAALFGINASMKLGRSAGLEEYQEFAGGEVKDFPFAGMVWEPYRISDDTLKADAEALNAGLFELYELLADIHTTSSVDDWHEKCSEEASRLGALTKKMQLRMDELDW